MARQTPPYLAPEDNNLRNMALRSRMEVDAVAGRGSEHLTKDLAYLASVADTSIRHVHIFIDVCGEFFF